MAIQPKSLFQNGGAFRVNCLQESNARDWNLGPPKTRIYLARHAGFESYFF